LFCLAFPSTRAHIIPCNCNWLCATDPFRFQTLHNAVLQAPIADFFHACSHSWSNALAPV
jgi:hypothetical protein